MQTKSFKGTESRETNRETETETKRKRERETRRESKTEKNEIVYIKYTFLYMYNMYILFLIKAQEKFKLDMTGYSRSRDVINIVKYTHNINAIYYYYDRQRP